MRTVANLVPTWYQHGELGWSASRCILFFLSSSESSQAPPLGKRVYILGILYLIRGGLYSRMWCPDGIGREGWEWAVFGRHTHRLSVYPHTQIGCMPTHTGCLYVHTQTLCMSTHADCLYVHTQIVVSPSPSETTICVWTYRQFVCVDIQRFCVWTYRQPVCVGIHPICVCGYTDNLCVCLPNTPHSQPFRPIPSGHHILEYGPPRIK
jgi:hypothetical protein